MFTFCLQSIEKDDNTATSQSSNDEQNRTEHGKSLGSSQSSQTQCEGEEPIDNNKNIENVSRSENEKADLENTTTTSEV